MRHTSSDGYGSENPNIFQVWQEHLLFIPIFVRA